tara:strand:- start:97 stop:450 length:354 start_codon:yes stop_codon:yes gene_type:complete
MKIKINDIKFDEKGLIPAIVQDHVSNEILMVAYMNKESIKQTIEIKEAVFWSRSRQEIWHKGLTSGDYLKVKDLILDCDLDAILLIVEMIGQAACHTGTKSCFIEPNSDQMRSLLAQ